MCKFPKFAMFGIKNREFKPDTIKNNNKSLLKKHFVMHGYIVFVVSADFMVNLYCFLF